MKRIVRADSPEGILEKSGSSDVLAYKLESFSKSFRRKHNQNEPTTVSSTNLIKTFSKTRTRVLRESPPKPSERRSNSKGPMRPIEKVSLAGNAYTHVHAMPTTAKLLKVLAIFSKKVSGCAVESIQSQNEEYFEQVLEWQKLQIYDQIDRLVFKLTQQLTNTLLSALEKANKQFDSKMQRYQALIFNLEQQTQRLTQANNRAKKIEELAGELQKRATEEYHKNQWSNAILQQITRTGVDLDSFIRKVPLYRYFAYGEDAGSQSQKLENSMPNGCITKYQINIRQIKSEVLSQRDQSNKQESQIYRKGRVIDQSDIL